MTRRKLKTPKFFKNEKSFKVQKMKFKDPIPPLEKIN